MTLKTLLIPLLFLLTLIAGYWVSRAGRPINPLRFNLHKFLALGAVILAGLRLAPRLQEETAGTGHLWLTILLAILVVALFATGAFQSRPGPGNPRLKTVHAVAAYAALAAVGGVIYLLPDSTSPNQSKERILIIAPLSM